MADAILNDKDFYKGSGDPYKSPRESMEKTEKAAKELTDLLKNQTLKTLQDLEKQYKNVSQSTKVNSDALKKLQAAEKQQLVEAEKLAKIEKIQADTKVRLAREAEILAKKTDIEKKAQERARKEKEKAEKASKALDSAYKIESRTLTQLRNKAKDLAVTLGEDSKEFKQAAREVNKLDSRLKKIDKTLGQSQRDVGNYAKAWGGIKKALPAVGAIVGVGTAITGIARGVLTSIKTFSEFNLQTSKLGAISKATGAEQKALEQDAQRLGATTQKTASQVAQLQIEYAKLGFKPKEILNATEATLNLSIATGENLADAASVAGATLRGFGLDANETGRVADVMAASFSSSALDLEKFRESMKLVAPIASAANIDLETTTALLGNLADSGLAGSIAGTGLKNVISKLSNENSDLSKELGFTVKNSDDLITAFKMLEERNIDLTKATELTDERSKAAFLTMVKGIDSIEGLQKSLKNASGSAKNMADVMADNLAGDTDKAKSALEGLQITIGKRLNRSVRSVVSGFTSFVGKIDEMLRLKPSEELRREAIELDNLVQATMNANNTQESRNRLITELQKKYPNFLKNLDAETVTNDQLRARLEEVNGEYQKKIQLLVQQELVAEAQEEIVKLQREELTLVKKLTKAEFDLEKTRGQTMIVGDQIINLELEAARAVKRLTGNLEENRQAQQLRNNALQRDLNLLTELQGEQEEVTEVVKNDTQNIEQNTQATNNNTEAKRQNFQTVSEIYAEIERLEQEQLERDIAELEALSEAELAAFEKEEEIYNKRIEAAENAAQRQAEIAEELESRKQSVREASISNAESALNQLANIEEGANEIQKAAYLASRGIAIARIIANTAIANSEAVAAFPLTAGQPWVGINTAAAALSIGEILSQAVTDFKFKDGVIDLQGKGTSTSDSIPALLSKGESVMTAKETQDSNLTLRGIREKGWTDKDIIPALTGLRSLELRQDKIVFDTKRMESKLNGIENLLANQLYILPKDGYNIMDRKLNRIQYDA